MNASILIIDDEPGICTSLTLALEDRYRVEATTSPEEAIHLLKEGCYNLCLLDLRIGRYDGIELLDELKRIDKDLEVILMTAYGSINSSVEAIRRGAYTYLTKPLNIDELYDEIEKALRRQELNGAVVFSASRKETELPYAGIVGQSPAIRNIFRLIDKLKDVDTNVLITGESGTGKELVARALHSMGRRKNENFEEVNCAAIPESLLEEELFGHKKGSFTGAIEDKKGKFEFAHNGTIFLDEIGDMPLTLQAKLLRVLQEKEYTPIGSNARKKVNVRVISATNKNLAALVDEGAFRLDLYYRLKVVEIKLPALRERKQDLPLLFEMFIKKYNGEFGKDIKGLSKEVEFALLRYPYKGNIRELENIFEYAMVLCSGELITIEDLPEEVRASEDAGVRDSGVFMEDLTGLSFQEMERRMIKATLKKNNGHRRKTAAMLGISEKCLRNKILEYNIL